MRNFPAVALLGPRQCGKTTLAKSFAGEYFDLERKQDQELVDTEWERLSKSPAVTIFDEAHQWPEIFSRLRSAIDQQRNRNGRFMLLGSVSPALMINVSQSLAGRLALVELTPFLLAEVPLAPERQFWLYGGYPNGGILDPRTYPTWERDYLTVLTQRDLPLWGLRAAPQTMERFVRMLAVAHAQPWNASQIGKSMGLDYKTVNTYLDYLVGTFLIRRLQPFHANIRKRLVKSPKMYFRDTGLLHALMNVTSIDQLLIQPWVGASWEGFVIEQILGSLSAAGKFVEPYYFRTSDQHEIDLVLDFGTERWAVEIKLSSVPTPHDMERLTHSANLIHAARRFLLSTSSAFADGGAQVMCNLPAFLKILHAR